MMVSVSVVIDPGRVVVGPGILEVMVVIDPGRVTVGPGI